MSKNSDSWPIFVLRENGDVYLLLAGSADHAHSQFSSRLRGPLTMSPPADDNYGLDSCSILCLETTPPIIAICTREGKVYHAVVLEAEREDEDKETTTTTPTLFVYEAVELELTFNVPLPETPPEDVVECVIQLRKDPSNVDRYHCCHQAGRGALYNPESQFEKKTSSR